MIWFVARLAYFHRAQPMNPNTDRKIEMIETRLMKRSIVLVLALAMVIHIGFPTTEALGQKVVTASQVNGTWRSGSKTFKVWALGKQRLKVQFLGTYEYKTPAGWMANVGEGSGIASIERDTAIFKPEAADEDCKITMKFKGGKLFVSQEGGCDFGHNVIADGTYRKISSRKPKFEEY